MEKGSDRVAAPMTTAAVKKYRRIVSWTPEEDESLREQVSTHGPDTVSWTSIAAKFKDKTSRQCRRRWYTYLNAECKKGGWSAEEDVVLCEAQRIFGNRWTEIAKVVSGRTDNAVKNRFSTLCKKRAKVESSLKENNSSSINANNKRIMVQKNNSRAAESSASSKNTRCLTSDILGSSSANQQMVMGQDTRPPLAEIVQNINSVCSVPVTQCIGNKMDAVSNKKVEGYFLKRDDPKVTGLLQQAELLSSLAQKVNSVNTKQSLEDAWKELQDYLTQTGKSCLLGGEISAVDFLLEDFRDLIEDLRSENSGGQPSGRKLDLHDVSLVTSECSTGSTGHSDILANESQQHDKSLCNDDAEIGHTEVLCSQITVDQANQIAVESTAARGYTSGNALTAPNSDFGSPVQMVPPFQSFADGVSSPKFTTSERRFLRSVLSMPSPAPSPNTSQMPSCKRVLLNSL